MIQNKLFKFVKRNPLAADRTKFKRPFEFLNFIQTAAAGLGENRMKIGIHTCPGADHASAHSAGIAYAELLPYL
jgi:hypothetical protein